MQRILLELAVAIVLTLGTILASVTGASASDVIVTEAFARASATPVAKSAVAYLTLLNHGAEIDRLVAISTPAAQAAELHSTVMDGDMMNMQSVGVVDLLPGAALEMKPGGLHVMLTGLTVPLKQGSEIELTLRFEKAPDMTVKVPVGSVAAGSQDHSPDTSAD